MSVQGYLCMVSKFPAGGCELATPAPPVCFRLQDDSAAAAALAVLVWKCEESTFAEASTFDEASTFSPRCLPKVSPEARPSTFGRASKDSKRRPPLR